MSSNIHNTNNRSKSRVSNQYKCKPCTKSCTNKEKSSQKDKHKDEQIQCYNCPENFDYRKELKDHKYNLFAMNVQKIWL